MASVVSGGEGVSEKKEVAGFEAFALERYFDSKRSSRNG